MDKNWIGKLLLRLFTDAVTTSTASQFFWYRSILPCFHQSTGLRWPRLEAKSVLGLCLALPGVPDVSRPPFNLLIPTSNFHTPGVALQVGQC